MTIDEDGLKQEIKNRLMGAFVGGGFGAAYVEASVDVDGYDTDETIAAARRLGIPVSNYINDDEKDPLFYR